MLARRLISAAVIITITILILWLDFWLGLDSVWGRPGICVSLLALIVAAAASDELVSMFANAAARVNRIQLMVATTIMIAITTAPVLWRDYPPDCVLGRFGFGLSGLVAGTVFIMLGEMLSYDNKAIPGNTIDRMGRCVFTLVYLNMLFAFVMAHRYLIDNTYGLMTIVAMIATVKTSDAAAYFTGRAYGKNKLAPALSPGKTIEGSVGGVVGGVVGAGLVIWVIAPALTGVTFDKAWWWVLIYGVLVTLAGMFGDLAESLLKRDTSTKDSATWLPGLGGVLDVIDSLVFAAPVSFLLWI